jgi:hypothetical protein
VRPVREKRKPPFSYQPQVSPLLYLARAKNNTR